MRIIECLTRRRKHADRKVNWNDPDLNRFEQATAAPGELRNTRRGCGGNCQCDRR